MESFMQPRSERVRLQNELGEYPCRFPGVLQRKNPSVYASV